MSTPFSPNPGSQQPQEQPQQPQGPQFQPQGPQFQPQGPQFQPQGPQFQPQGPQFQPQFQTQQQLTQPKTRSDNAILGIIALACAVIGFITACIPGIRVVGGVLLPVGFILGVVALIISKKKGLAIAAILISILGTVVAAIITFFVLGKAVDDALEASGLSTGEPTAVAPDGEAESGDDSLGSSRENPLPIGSTVETDDWAYTVNSVDLNATDEVVGDESFNDPPADGEAYAVVNLTVTYKGDDPGGKTPEGFIDYVTADGNTSSWYDNLVYIDSQLDLSETLYEGASTTGDLVFTVPADTAGEGTLAIQPSVLGGKKFVAVQ